MAVARGAALGDLAADVAHDVANPLFGVLGLVDLLLEDAAPDSEDETRLRLLRQSALEMKRTLQALLDFARAAPGTGGPADAAASARAAIDLVRHGIGKTLAVEERYLEEPALVACGDAELRQALLHLLLAARRTGGPVELAVSAGTVRVAPSAAEDLGVLLAARIAADCGGSLAVEHGAYLLRLPPV